MLNNFLVGCDPEFVAFAGNELQNVSGTFSKSGPVGYDHRGFVLEVRPRPAIGTYALVKRIRKLFTEYNLKELGWRYRAGAFLEIGDFKLALGGHVHLDVPWDDMNAQLRTNALDELTKLLEAEDILPEKQSAQRRARFAGDKYGAFSDVRAGGNTERMEYRTMASWLFHPVTAFVCLTGAKLCAAKPREALQILKAKSISKFFETFREDENARRVIERLLNRNVPLQRDPEAEVLASWKSLAVLGGA